MCVCVYVFVCVSHGVDAGFAHHFPCAVLSQRTPRSVRVYSVREKIK